MGEKMMDETGVRQRIQTSIGKCSSSSVVNQGANQSINQGINGGNYVQLGINNHMQNLSVLEGNFGKRPVGIPPSHPHSYLGGGGAAAAAAAAGGGSGGGGGQHSRSLSQPSFSFDQLPPLSPSMIRESPTASSDRVSGEGGSGGGGGGGGNVQGLSLPPRRGGHRRSSSDVPLGFDMMSQNSQFQYTPPAAKPAQLVLKSEAEWRGSGSGNGSGNGAEWRGSGSGNVSGNVAQWRGSGSGNVSGNVAQWRGSGNGNGSEGVSEKENEGDLAGDLFTAYMNFDAIDAFNSSSMEDKDSRASGTRTNESSENEVESSSGISSNSVERMGKRGAVGDIAPTGRHFRSLSMDSVMGNLNFNDELPRLPSSPGVQSAQLSPSSSMDGSTTNLFSSKLAVGQFSPDEWRKIMANEKLAEVAKTDPKRVKRILANRVSAARSKERKMRYVAQLEQKVQTLQGEATSLSAKLTAIQRDSAGVATQNNELRFRLQAMQQQAQLKDALSETLKAELQRLKIAAQFSGCVPQQQMANNHVFQMQPSQYMYQSQQQLQSQNQTTPPQTQQSRHRQSAEPEQGAGAYKN